MTARWFRWGSGRLRGEGGVFASHPPCPLLLLPLIPPPPFQPTRGEGGGWRPDARRRRAHRRWRLSRSWSRVHDSGPRRRASPRRAEGVWSLSKYSSSHKDWACWAGLHPPSNADALCAIPPRAPRLYVHQTSSRGGAEERRGRARFPQGPLDGAAPVAGRGRLVRHGRPGRWSTYLRTAIIRQSPRRRALHSIAEGFSPTARAHTGCIAQSPSARRLIRQSGFNAQSPSAPRQAPLSAISYRVSSIGYRLFRTPPPGCLKVRYLHYNGILQRTS